MPGTRTPTYPLGLPAEQRERWQAEADKRGVSLAEFIRRAVDRDIELGPGAAVPAPGTGAHAYPRVGGKEFKGPDPKSKPRPSSR